MKDQTELILIACLDRLEMGESIDDILQQYPDVAAELRPVLETAVFMNQLAISPTLAANRRQPCCATPKRYVAPEYAPFPGGSGCGKFCCQLLHWHSCC